MAEFVIRTVERVEGTYRVSADCAEQARAKLAGGPPIDWDGVEQVDYQAFDVTVEAVTSVAPGVEDRPGRTEQAG